MLAKLDSMIYNSDVSLKEKQMQLEYRSQIVDSVNKQLSINHSFVKVKLREVLQG